MSDATANPRTNMRRQLAWLAAFALVIALVLAGAYQLTRERIAYQQHQTERQALDAVLPAALHDNDLLATSFTLAPDSNSYQQLSLLGLSTTRNGYRATLAGNATGVILPLEAQGYGGPIVLLIGIDTTGKITGVRVQQHAESPGLGDKIEIRVSPWITVFDKRNLDDTPEPLWHVKKDGGDFDQFTGATTTPRAVVGAVYNALRFFELNQQRLLQPQEPR